MLDLISFIPQQLTILVAATSVLGIFLKNINIVEDNFIPIALLMFTVVFSISTMGLCTTSILQGIICWGVSTGIYDVLHEVKKYRR